MLTYWCVQLQPSAAKQIVNFEDVKDEGDKKDLTNFGLRTDIYGKKSAKVGVREACYVRITWTVQLTGGHLRQMEGRLNSRLILIQKHVTKWCY